VCVCVCVMCVWCVCGVCVVCVCVCVCPPKHVEFHAYFGFKLVLTASSRKNRTSQIALEKTFKTKGMFKIRATL